MRGETFATAFVLVAALLTPPTAAVEPDWPKLIDQAAKSAGRYVGLKDVQRRVPRGVMAQVDADKLMAWIERELVKHPLSTSKERNRLFTALDLVAVDSVGRGYAPLRAHRMRTTLAVLGAARTPPPRGRVVVYKLYNEGTIVRTHDTTLGIDIVLEPANNSLAKGFAQQLDALLVSHDHNDHYDAKSRLYAELRAAGKPLIFPKDNSAVPMGGVLASGKIKSMRWTAFRGRHVHPGFSNFFRVDAGGVAIVHSGDNTRWLQFAKTKHARDIDVLLLKPEAMHPGEGFKHDHRGAMRKSLAALRPKLVVPQHLLELGHRLGAYGHDLGLQLEKQLPAGSKLQMLHWGESITLVDE